MGHKSHGNPMGTGSTAVVPRNETKHGNDSVGMRENEINTITVSHLQHASKPTYAIKRKTCRPLEKSDPIL